MSIISPEEADRVYAMERLVREWNAARLEFTRAAQGAITLDRLANAENALAAFAQKEIA